MAKPCTLTADRALMIIARKLEACAVQYMEYPHSIRPSALNESLPGRLDILPMLQNVHCGLLHQSEQDSNSRGAGAEHLLFSKARLSRLGPGALM